MNLISPELRCGRVIPRLVDDGSIKADIDVLRPTTAVDETPRGRLAGINEDTWRVYTEMYELLTGNADGLSPMAYEERLRDLAESLSDLHKRGEHSPAVNGVRRQSGGDETLKTRDKTGSKEVMAARYPPDGDVQRWVAEGPTGHVDFGPGRDVTGTSEGSGVDG